MLRSARSTSGMGPGKPREIRRRRGCSAATDPGCSVRVFPHDPPTDAAGKPDDADDHNKQTPKGVWRPRLPVASRGLRAQSVGTCHGADEHFRLWQADGRIQPTRLGTLCVYQPVCRKLGRAQHKGTDGARSVLGNKLLQKVQRFWGSVKRRFIGHDIPGAVTVLSGTEPIVP